VQKQGRAKNEIATGPRAAQYLRVSTGQQKYSIENQAAAIAAYAVRRNISIVRTYSDQRSGVRIVGRDGLQRLIRDAQHGRADFDCILVYDVIIRFCSILTTLYPLLRNAKLALGLKHSGQLLMERRLCFPISLPIFAK
jgi:hypothetical protein